jgi:F-type H+-transporting ATPase subunit delta
MIKIASKRYSQSLFEAALEQNKLDLVFDELAGLKVVIADNQSFFKALEYPFITLDEKNNIISEVFSQSFDPVICDFLKVLIEKDRITILNEILKDFEELYYDYNKLLKVQITTAFELEEDYKEKLKLKLKEVFKEDVVIEVNIDPTIIGGLFIRAKDKIIDATVKGKLDRMKDNLLYDKTEVR